MTEKKNPTPANAGKKQDGRFQPGQSGNPNGKVPGTRNKATLAVQELLAGETEALTRKAIEMALAGDTVALRLCLDRIAPALKSTAPMVNLYLPAPDSLTDTARAFVAAAASGELAPDIAAQLVAAVAAVARVEELESVKERLAALERAIKEQKR